MLEIQAIIVEEIIKSLIFWLTEKPNTGRKFVVVKYHPLEDR